jgi:hypothetical protein
LTSLLADNNAGYAQAIYLPSQRTEYSEAHLAVEQLLSLLSQRFIL